MQHKNGEQHGPRLEILQPWQKIELCGNPKYERTEEKIRGEDVHGT
jgi:hypothetical protein